MIRFKVFSLAALVLLAFASMFAMKELIRYENRGIVRPGPGISFGEIAVVGVVCLFFIVMLLIECIGNKRWSKFGRLALLIIGTVIGVLPFVIIWRLAFITIS